MPLSRIGVPYPPHYLFDTLDMTRRLYPAWSSHSLENVAIRLNVASGAERWALSDARLVKDMFLSMLQRTPTLKKISELMRVSQPLTFADAPGCAIEAPAGFEALTSAIAERCAITIIYERGLQRAKPRRITPRLLLEGRFAQNPCLIGTARDVQGGGSRKGREEAGTYSWARSIVARARYGQLERFVSLRIRAHDALRASFR